MPWGPILSIGLKLVGNFMLNRMDPDRVKFWDLLKLRRANKKQESAMNKAMRNKDVKAINEILAAF